MTSHARIIAAAFAAALALAGCSPSKNGTTCMTDSQCNGGKTCVNQKCVAPATGGACESDSDCTGGQTCVVRVCTSPAGSCTANADCPSGQVCQNHACQTPGGTCLSNADCSGSPATPACNPATNTCVGCVQQSDCPSAAIQTCTASNTCVFNPGACENNSDCASGGGDTHVCNATINTCVGCVTNSDCPVPQVCAMSTNTCATSTMTGCTSSGDCASNAAMPICDTTSGVCTQCFDGVGCATNQDCVNDVCQTVDAGPPPPDAGPVPDAGLAAYYCKNCTLDTDCGGGTIEDGGVSSTGNYCVKIGIGHAFCATACTTAANCAPTANCMGITEGAVTVGTACVPATEKCGATDGGEGDGGHMRDAGESDGGARDAGETDAGPSDGGTGCTANSQCINSTRPVCNMATGACVQCVRNNQCSSPTPYCEVATDTCVECTPNDPCKLFSQICTASDTCVTGCTSNSNCSGVVSYCDTTTQMCVQCLNNSDCATGEVCSASDLCEPADAGPVDAGHPDAGAADAGHPDAGAADAGHPDAGHSDAGHVDAGPG